MAVVIWNFMEYLNVRIDSPEKVIWEGKATSVSSVNSEGNFDILPEHASFITFVENKPVIVREEKKELGRYTFERAILYVHNNVVTIYTNI